ncbi:MAG: hypothetical protein ACRDLL_14345 [Solirubrobacterales bacterium]
MPDKDLRTDLAAAEERLRNLRAERARIAKIAADAKAAAQDHESDASMSAAVSAKQALEETDRTIAAESERQVELLRRLGDAEQGRAGFSYIGVDGFAEAARKLSLARNELRYDVAAAALLTPNLTPSARQSVPSPVQGAANGGAVRVSNRWLYPVLASAPFGALAGDLASTDFTVSVSQDALTGVDIETATDTQKATLTPDIGLATPTARTFAVVARNLPSVLFDQQDALRAVLANEIGRRLSDAYDEHVVGAIEDADPPNASTGSDLVAKIRNALADAHDLGSEPTVLALTPSDAASLDLTQDDGGYTFRVDAPRVEGAGSPVWSLAVREVPTISHPTLIDPVLIGLTYYGGASILVDPYSSLEKNQVRVRVEAEAVFHVRNIDQGAFQIS